MKLYGYGVPVGLQLLTKIKGIMKTIDYVALYALLLFCICADAYCLYLLAIL